MAKSLARAHVKVAILLVRSRRGRGRAVVRVLRTVVIAAVRTSSLRIVSLAVTATLGASSLRYTLVVTGRQRTDEVRTHFTLLDLVPPASLRRKSGSRQMNYEACDQLDAFTTLKKHLSTNINQYGHTSRHVTGSRPISADLAT